MRYINYILLGLLFGILYIIGIPLFFINYPFRDFIRKHKILPFYYFLHDQYGNVNNWQDDYGDINWRTNKGFPNEMNTYSSWSKMWLSFLWVAIRNSHWNLKLMLAPKKGKKENVKGELEFRRYNLKGKQFATYEIDGSKYFRWSWSNGNTYFQFGASNARYIYKFKHR